ncbi:MAG: hypothetical protein IIZ94_13260 [Prevotella sp.]|nr:hypothetical protein [Prevotella sp.]
MTREEAIQELKEINTALESWSGFTKYPHALYIAIDMAIEALSTDAKEDWITDKPTEQGRYMVTIDSFRYKHIDLFHYGKPMMPNRKVRGMCWYRSDDEWGDVVYDDKDILAWMPLPTPYKGGDDE